MFRVLLVAPIFLNGRRKTSHHQLRDLIGHVHDGCLMLMPVLFQAAPSNIIASARVRHGREALGCESPAPLALIHHLGVLAITKWIACAMRSQKGISFKSAFLTLHEVAYSLKGFCHFNCKFLLDLFQTFFKESMISQW